MFSPDEFRRLYAQLLTEHGLSARSAVHGRRVARRAYGAAVRSNDEDEIRRFLAWCEAEDVDPARWVAARHDAVRWAHAIPIKRLRSPKFLIKFRSWGDRKQAAEAGQDRVRVGLNRPSRWRARKLRAVLSAEDCRNVGLLEGVTWYDSADAACMACPLAGECSRG